MMRALLVLALAACQSYAHTSRLNAPGNIELDKPMPLENGDPKRFVPPTEPGSETIAIIAAPYIAGGVGRYEPGRDGSGEVGLEIRVEHVKSEGRELMKLKNWGVTAGFAIVQWGHLVRTLAPGAFSAEVSYRSRISTWPVELGLGPAFYVDDPSVGGQVTARCAIMMARTRYVANSGVEFLVGLDIPVPFFFSWSR